MTPAIDHPSLPTEAGGPSASAPASAWYALAVLVATTLLAFVDRQIINLIAPSLQRDLGISDLQLGIMHGLGLALFASAAAYPIGWLSDRYGRRLVLGCCVLVWSIATGACAFQTDFTGVFIATAGIAIGEAALGPIIFSILPDLFPERQRNTANFIFFGVTLLGVAIGFGLGGATLGFLEQNRHAFPASLSAMESWRVALILVALPAPLFILLLTTIRMRPHPGFAVAASDGEASLDRVVPFLQEHWRPFALIYAAIFVYTLPLSAAFPWMPIAIQRMFTGVPSSSVGTQMGIAIGVGSIVGLALPPIGLRFLRGDPAIRPLQLACIVLCIATVPASLMLFASAPWQLYALVGAQLAALLSAGALMPGVLQQLSPPGLRSRLISLLGICGAIAGGLSPMLVAALAGALDAREGLITAIVVVSLPSWVTAALLMSFAKGAVARTTALCLCSGQAAERD